MKNIKRVLIGVDLSDYSKETIESALTLAKGSDREFLILNVINVRDIDALHLAKPEVPKEEYVEKYITTTEAARLLKIEQMLDEYFPADKDKIKIIFRVGTPYKKLLETAEEEKVDLVVIASKGRSNLIGTLHGSNAENVFRHSPVPVLCVRRGTTVQPQPS
jgi:nucleotide-binding universal stress UspA family protein